MSVNRITLLGRVGGNPEVRTLPSGQRVAALRLATRERWKDAKGQPHEHTEWHRLVLWAGLADLAERYIEKGRELYVEGRVQTRQWQDASGQRRFSTEIVATIVQLIGAKKDTTTAEEVTPNTTSPATAPEPITTPSPIDAVLSAAIEASWSTDAEDDAERDTDERSGGWSA